MKIFLRASSALLACLFLLSACSGLGNLKKETSYPQDPEDRRRAARGRLTGDEGLVIFGGKKETQESEAAGIGINSYLWRASLDTVSFMPLNSADPFGGVIITDWYENPEYKGERFKVNILILDKKLRSNAVKVSVFKQYQDNKGVWRDMEASSDTARKLEDKILTRARELRVKN